MMANKPASQREFYFGFPVKSAPGAMREDSSGLAVKVHWNGATTH